jgi:cholesterol oxidase
MNRGEQYDYVIIGSGFGGSVSALRLAEKGYKVLVIEKGKWYQAKDFPKTSWNLPKWLWVPALRWYGIMKISIFKHVAVLSGTGVGGGSLVYANTLPIPKTSFFTSGSWQGLSDWETELAPHYKTARYMLGASKNPTFFAGDQALQQMAQDMGQEEQFDAPYVAVHFGPEGETVPDPYFGGKGPDRNGCINCGACMTGCRHNAKNTLDKNYLYFAQQLGVDIWAEKEVVDVLPLEEGRDGYEVRFKSTTGWFAKTKGVRTKGVIFAGGVSGTVKLLLKLKQSSLPKLSDMVGKDIRTNNESLVCITSLDKEKDFSRGVAIGSILHTDKDSHLEVVRYGAGSGSWRLTMLPQVEGKTFWKRIGMMFRKFFSDPLGYLKLITVRDWAKNTAILLFMQSLDSRLRFSLNRSGRMVSTVQEGEKPSAFIPRALELAARFEKLVKGKARVFFMETVAGVPSTAHILGGAVMGSSPEEGVIDQNNQVFGYENMMVCDGSMISANPGVNPSLSITAISERAMSKIPAKTDREASPLPEVPHKR